MNDQNPLKDLAATEIRVTDQDILHAMRRAGWSNPDGVGYLYIHPDLPEDLVIHADTALRIQMGWESNPSLRPTRVEKKP